MPPLYNRQVPPMLAALMAQQGQGGMPGPAGTPMQMPQHQPMMTAPAQGGGGGQGPMPQMQGQPPQGLLGQGQGGVQGLLNPMMMALMAKKMGQQGQTPPDVNNLADRWKSMYDESAGGLQVPEFNWMPYGGGLGGS